MNSLKREVGIPVEFANEAGANKDLQGDGNLAAKVITANSWNHKELNLFGLKWKINSISKLLFKKNFHKILKFVIFY